MSDKVIGKLIKMESFQPDQNVLEIRKGDVMQGFFNFWPVVDFSFMFYVNNKIDDYKVDGFRVQLSMPADFSYPIQTTIVTEIIDDRTFKTKNSIYKIVTLEDERDEKIKLIFK